MPLQNFTFISHENGDFFFFFFEADTMGAEKAIQRYMMCYNCNSMPRFKAKYNLSEIVERLNSNDLCSHLTIGYCLVTVQL